jgi:hypothetical protein
MSLGNAVAILISLLAIWTLYAAISAKLLHKRPWPFAKVSLKDRVTALEARLAAAEDKIGIKL